MILASRHSWARLVAAIAFTIACMNVHVDAKQAPKKKQKTTAVKSSAKKSKSAAKTTAKPADKHREGKRQLQYGRNITSMKPNSWIMP